MKKAHPYIGLPDYQFWKKSFGSNFINGLDPVSSTRFTIDIDTKIVSAGSCFAQHLARHIKKRGFNFLQTEKIHPIFSVTSWDDANAATFNYESFSARYGNIYTARQLRQLIDRAYDRFSPISAYWQKKDGIFIDPFRPQVEPDGFISIHELDLDRRHHLVAVRNAIEQADVFVFTLGLTEAWVDKRDGAVFPIAPGVAGGVFEPDIHEFKNFNVRETIDDMSYSIDRIRAVNPKIKILLTVSPVPLNATYEQRHVLQSTVYSKSVLRVAAEEMRNTYDFVDYFPSFEIITSPQCGGQYFANDMRSIEESGVAHVMEVFFSHYAVGETSSSFQQSTATSPADRHAEMERLIEILCDEEAIDN
ncbi:GSCFA domain-containing protein [Neorhizobium alkalisoli]|uniref:GSCFA family protein n=1 Tax=Neorhizobium alkalisoli TaxID=528178 RepID=A0A561QH09_9HYPH|nr:GSCFA domain-containing protein [Neorhizobium alkalisoli]TWF49645.1 GSCFA family protein [Neorhizobium alkalisoli]